MKGITKRLWAMALAIIMVFGLLPVVQLTADAVPVVDYVTDSDTGYIYNWGTREEEATFLSPNATAFYTDNYTYDALSVLPGSANLNTVPDSDLYGALQTLMTDKHSYKTSYDATRPMFQYTDCQGSALESDKISSFYSGKAIGPAWDAGATWNREHTWPNSKGLNGQDENDIMMLRPTAESENGGRSNTCYGESDGYYFPNQESNGAHDVRGDVARIALYVYVRWGNTEKLWGPDTEDSGVIESKEIMLKWMEEDPVDTWELGRNDSVQSITGTRNVFVDYPELAFLLFGEEIPADMVTPSGKAANSTIDYTLTAVANDNTMGTVTVNANIITAFPAFGYYVEGYEVTAGTATVTRSGNTFTVSATQDCMVTINFAVAATANATYMANGAIVQTIASPIDESFVLPAYENELPEGFSFYGWALSAFDATEDISSTEILLAGKSYTMPASGVVFHAVYTYMDKSATGGWVAVSDAALLSAGDQLIIAAKDDSAVAGTLSGKYLLKLDATFRDNTISALPNDVLILTLGGNAGAWTLTDDQGRRLGANSSPDLTLGTDITTTWKITGSNGALTVSDTSNTESRLQYNSDHPRFKTYTSSQTGIQLYKLDANAESVHYATTLPEICLHTNTVYVHAQAPTATEAGWTEGVYCYGCEKYIEGHTVLIPTGAGCLVSFVVPEGVAPVDSVLCYNNGITLPTAEAPEGYEFLGWTEAPVAETETRPDYLNAGAKYTNATDTCKVFYALYKFTRIEAGGSGAPVWKLAENLSDLAVGKQVIIAAAGYNVAMSATQDNNNRKGVTITKNADGTATFDETAVAILTLESGKAANTYAFNTGSGYLYSNSGTANQLKTETTLSNASSFKIELSGSTWTALSQSGKSRNNLRYNNAPNNGNLFACYGSGQQPICFYVKTETAGGVEVNYYTSLVDATCAHANTDFDADSKKAATCTEDGHTGKIYCADCKTVLGTGFAIDATAHASAEFVPAFTAENPCTDISWVAHYDCAECGKLVLDKTADAEVYTLPTAAGHTDTELVNASAATCTENGYTGDVFCNACNTPVSTGSVIPATGHAEAVFVPAHTAENPCTDISWVAHYDCAECGKLVLDKTADAEVYTLPTAPGHDYEADATTCGVCGHNRAELALTTATLRASAAAIYFKGEFDIKDTDEVVKYGIAVSIYDQMPAVDDSETTKYTIGTSSALITDILDGSSNDRANAKMKIYARAYVEFTDGTIAYSEVATVSLRQLVLAIDARFDTLSLDQQEALADMYDTYSVMASWKIPNLKDYIANRAAA